MTYHSNMRGLGDGLTAAAFPGGSSQTTRPTSLTMQYAPMPTLAPVRQQAQQPVTMQFAPLQAQPQPANTYVGQREAAASSANLQDPGLDVPPSGQDIPEQNGAEPNYMLWGGLALLVVAAGGGLYYYSKKK